jgi:poly-gamma-glutamate synthesis protein (capsule biosynthesis protein)
LKSQELRGRPTYAETLAESGFNVLSLANNHILQHGKEAFYDTVRNLERFGISPIGVVDASGNSAPAVRGAEHRVTCIGFSLRPEQYAIINTQYAQPNQTELLRQVRECAKSSEFLVVSLHWGHEYLEFPSSQQRLLGRAIIDCGASIVVGHHPHVPQPIEEYKSGLIAYSLGNFIFDTWLDTCRRSTVLSVEIDDNGIRGWKTVPYRITDNWHVTGLADDAKRADVAYLTDLSNRWASLNDVNLESTEDYLRKAAAAERAYSLDSYKYFARHLHKYPLWVTRQSLSRAFQRRVSR